MRKLKFLSFSFLIFLLLFALVGCTQPFEPNNQAKETSLATEKSTDGYPKSFIDGRGVEITLKEKPSRIVSTALAFDEILLSLVDIERIAAVTKISTDPGISNVAGLTDDVEHKFERITAEQVIALKPDLVLVPTYINPDVLDQLVDANLPIYQVKDDASIEGIMISIEEIGALVGEEEKAQEIIEDMKSRMSELNEKTSQLKEKKRVLYWTQYNSSVTDNTTIGEMIHLAGGINVISEAGIEGDEYPDYPTISKEIVVKLNPDVIITDTWDGTGKEHAFIEEWKKDPALSNVKAIKNNQVFIIRSAHLTTVSQYVMNGVEDIYKVLYGEQ